MSRLERAIKKTIAYSAFFDDHLTPSEVHFWLIGSHPVTLTKIVKSSALTSPSVSSLQKKKKHLKYSHHKITQAHRIASLLSIIPTVQLVAVTGSVAVGSAKYRDDIDLLIVTSNHSLWLTRPLVLLLLSIFSSRRLPGQTYHKAAHSFCPNLWLEKHSLAVPEHKRSLYTAHEVIFVTPLFDRSHIHQLFLTKNSWVKRHLANAYLLSKDKKPEISESPSFSIVLFPINLIMFIFQYIYMRSKLTTEYVGLRSAYFHTKDYGIKIRKHLSRVLR